MIEDNVGLWQNVTLGSRSINDLSPEQYPRVRSGARIYAGAVVIGAVEIGENATVGANSVVLEDVAPGCTVAGVPARLVRTSGSPRTM